MTEAEWLVSTGPKQMLEFLQRRASDRKLRLFACSVCRQLTSLVATDQYSRGIDVAEVFADTGKTKVALKRSRQVLTELRVSMVETSGRGQPDEYHALFLAVIALSEKDFRNFASCLSDLQANRGVTGLLRQSIQSAPESIRDIFGNPFRPVVFDPNWRTTTALSLARGIYDERAFDRLPILADALQDAGCTNDHILNHLRDTTVPHVRGCWALDLVLRLS